MKSYLSICAHVVYNTSICYQVDEINHFKSTAGKGKERDAKWWVKWIQLVLFMDKK